MQFSFLAFAQPFRSLQERGFVLTADAGRIRSHVSRSDFSPRDLASAIPRVPESSDQLATCLRRVTVPATASAHAPAPVSRSGVQFGETMCPR